MRIKSKKWKFLLGVVFVILLVPLTYVVTVPIAKPWVRWEADRRVAEWERLKAEGLALRRARKYDESESRLKQALAYAEEVLLVQPSRVASSAFALGGLYLLQERFDEARTCFERDLQIVEEREGPSSPALVPALAGATEACLELGDFDAALEYAQRAVSIREAEDRSPDPKLTSALSDLADIHEKQKNYKAALPIRGRVVGIIESEMRAKRRELAIARFREGVMHNILGDYAAAEKRYEESLSVLREVDTPDGVWTSELVHAYAQLLEMTGRADEAVHLRATVPQSKEGDRENSHAP